MKKAKRMPGLSPLADRADDLLARLRKKPTRGDVVASIQVAVVETLEALSVEMCFDCRPSDGTRHGQDHGDGERCGASELWTAWYRIQPRLWGKER